MPEDDATHRCSVCGETFESASAVERHLKDQGILW